MSICFSFFGGVKRQAVGESTTLGNIGIGKHWDIHEDVKLVTEIAAYHDFGEDYNDYSVKVGIAIPFGKGTPAAPKDSDNDDDTDDKDELYEDYTRTSYPSSFRTESKAAGS